MKITGELLKSERIKLKLLQQDIAFALKLSPRTINAIEEGDAESLPAKTFVRGFVKSYAEMLKLDTAMVLSQFQEEMGSTRPVSKIATPPVNDSSKIKTGYVREKKSAQQDMASVTPSLKMNLNKTTLKLVFVITFAVIVLGGINQVINKYQKEGSTTPEASKLTVENLTQEANANKELPAHPPPVEAPVTTAPITSASPTPVETKNPEIPVENALLEAKLSQTLITAKSVELVIEATKDTVVSYAVGADANYKTLELKKNTFQIIKSKNGLFLKTEEGNSISITVNGVSKGLASSDAKPVKLSY